MSRFESLLGRKGKLDKSLFAYDEEADAYRCPMGRELPFNRTVERGGKPGQRNTVREYKCKDCSACPLAGKCLSRKAKKRIVTRDEHEPLREALAARMRTEEAKQAYKRRAPLIETVFGYIKGVMGVRGFRARGRDRVRAEWLWICAAYNLTKLVAMLKRRETSDGGTSEPSPAGTDTSEPCAPILLSFRAPLPRAIPRALPLAA